MLLDLIAKHAAKDTCKGIFYRYTESVYTGEGGRMVFSKEIRPLKRMSCSGCEICGRQDESVKSLLSEFPGWAIDFNNRLKHDDIVQLWYVEDSRNCETNIVESYHYEAVAVKVEE